MQRLTQPVSIAAMLAFGCAFAAFAQEPESNEQLANRMAEASLEELLNTPLEVWSATKTAERSDEVAAIVSVYSRDEIRKWGYQSIAELLSHVLGFYVTDDHAFPNVAVRGVSGGLWSDSSIIKVMIDGHSVAFRPTGGNFIGPELIPISAIERVELIRGPASSLYGADAFLGVINIVTRSPQEQEAQLRLSLNRFGQNFGNGQDAAVGTKIGSTEVFLSYRHEDRDLSGLKLPRSSPSPSLPSYANRESPALHLQQGSHVGYGRLSMILGKVTLNVSGYASLTDREAAFSPWTQLAYGLDRQGRSNENHVSLVHGFLSAKAGLEVSPTLDLTLDTSFFAGVPTERDHIDVSSDVYFVKRKFSSVGFEGSFEARWRPVTTLTTIAGAGITFDREQLPSTLYSVKSSTGDSAAGSVVEDLSTRQGLQDFVDAAAYLLAIWQPFKPKLGITGGLRYDYHNIYGSVASGRIGLVSSPLTDFNIKLLYGNAFKAASPLLLYGVPLRSGDIIGNPNLKPQYVHTFEAYVSYRLKSLTLSSTLAFNYLLNKAEFVQSGANKISRNLGELETLSWESEARFRYQQIDSYLSLELNHTTRNVGYAGYQALLVGSAYGVYPPVLVRAGVSARVGVLPLSAGAELIFAAPRRATDDNILEAGQVYELPSYFMLGATVSTVGLKLFRDRETTFTFTARNLTNVQVADPGFSGVDYPLAPRSFFLGLQQEL
jgi:outer membrane receptor for ferrienterochelin and colicins